MNYVNKLFWDTSTERQLENITPPAPNGGGGVKITIKITKMIKMTVISEINQSCTATILTVHSA